MKALVVMPLSEIKGGSEMMFWQLMLHGRHKGVGWVTVFLTPGPLVDDTRALGIPTYVIETGRARDIGKTWQFHQALMKILRDEKITVVLGWIQSGHIYGGPAAWRAKLPAVWYQLGTPLGKTLRDRMTTLIPANGIIAVGGGIAEAQNEMRPQRPMRVVYPGVEFDRFNLAALPSPKEARKKLGLWKAGRLSESSDACKRGKECTFLWTLFLKFCKSIPTRTALLLAAGTIWNRNMKKKFKSK